MGDILEIISSSLGMWNELYFKKEPIGSEYVEIMWKSGWDSAAIVGQRGGIRTKGARNRQH